MAKNQLSAAEQVIRDDKVIALWSKRLPWKRIAEETGLTVSGAEKVVQRYKDSGRLALQENQALDTVFEMNAAYLAMEGMLAELAEDADQDSVKLGAVRELRNTLQARVELHQATGLMPKNLGHIKIDLDIAYFSSLVIAVFEKYGVDEDAQKEIIGALRERT